jgi:2-amino-4-hydroxy-6-hydroxymethyldihydropteridine diphosphokinase
MTALVRAYIGMGSNLADPASQMRRARAALAAVPEVQIRATSPVYRSPPMGPVDQPDYLNAVLAAQTGLAPLSLLDTLQAIERQQDRQRGRHWGPRTLDLDLLLYGEQVLITERLQVPHPGVHERAFVLYPLADIAPDLHVPGHGRVDELLKSVSAAGLQRLDGFSWTESG